MPIFRRSKPQSVAKSVIDHPVLGGITVARNPRARRISVSVRPPGKVRLTLPASVSLAEGVRFLESKADWIAKAVARAEKKAQPEAILPPYSTRRFSLALTPADTDKIRVRIGDGHISVTHPAALDPRSESVQAAIKKGIEEAWRIEAKELLPRRTAELAILCGLRYNSVAVRNTVSKWGSCSARNDISLSLHLMRLPDHLIDYIIIHELCHTIHKNHGPDFHALLGKLTGGQHPALRKQLRTYNTRW